MSGHTTTADLDAALEQCSLEQSCELPTPIEEYEPDISVDFHDARELLRRAETIMKYTSNEDILKTVSKRERGVMGAIAKQITEYLDEVTSKYDEWE